jgi:branched-chain amino acid transport system permease protein
MAPLIPSRSRAPATVGNWTLLSVTLVLCALFAAAPFFIGEGVLRLATEILVVFAMAQAWNLLAGYAGLLSIGHQVFVGTGAYAMFCASIYGGVSPYFAILAAPIASALLAALVAPLLFRLRDAYFSIGMWVLAEIVSILVGKSTILGKQNGLTLEALRAMDPAWVTPIGFWWAAAAGVGTTAMMVLMMRSRLGLGLMAVRDNDLAASSLGIDVWRSRFVAFVISGAGAGFAGAIYFLGPAHILPPSAFDPNWVVIVLFIVIIGGLGTIEGPIIGTVVYFGLREIFSDAGNWYLISLGAVAVGVMLAAPKGIWGAVSARTGIEVFSVRRFPPA